MEEIRVGIESGPESRCRTLSLPPGDPGDGHRARSTYRGTWVSHRTPYPCWSRWALEEETELKIPQGQDWGVALEMSIIVPRPLPPPGSHVTPMILKMTRQSPALSSQPPADGLRHRHLSSARPLGLFPRHPPSTRDWFWQRWLKPQREAGEALPRSRSRAESQPERVTCHQGKAEERGTAPAPSRPPGAPATLWAPSFQAA